MPSLSIFSCFKSFGDPHIARIQCNAVQSWLAFGPAVEVLVAGDDPAIEKIAEERTIRWLRGVRVNQRGRPLLSSVFELATRAAAGDILAYVNADIILGTDFLEAVSHCSRLRRPFVMVGCRWDLDFVEAITFEDPFWWPKLRDKARREGRRHAPSGLDYFIFPKKHMVDIPSFTLGGPAWDNWLLAEMGKRGVLRIDATADVVAIHQNHAPGWVNPSTAPKDSDEWRNRELACGHYADAWDCEFELVAGRVRLARSREHLERRVETWAARWPWLPTVLPSTKLRHAAAWVENAMRGYGRIALSR